MRAEDITEEAMKSILRSAEIKVTPARVVVLSRLVEAAGPLSHAEIHAKIPDMDRVTLYRTLATFVEADIAHQVQGLDGMWRFCAHSRGAGGCPGNHPHFLCTVCGRMTCLLDQSMPRVEVPDVYSVHGKQFVAYGICGECLSAKQQKKRESAIDQ